MSTDLPVCGNCGVVLSTAHCLADKFVSKIGPVQKKNVYISLIMQDLLLELGQIVWL